jgi:hypothetical protein
MELHRLADLAKGMKTLAELEEQEPRIGAEFLTFLNQVSSACWDAYTNFSRVLNQVIALPNPPDRAAYDRVSTELATTYDHQWFKVVADVCSRLKAADRVFGPSVNARIGELRKEISEKIPASGPTPPEVQQKEGTIWTLGSMIGVLQMHEGGLEDEIASNVRFLQGWLADGFAKGDISRAKEISVEIQTGIRGFLNEIQQTVLAAQATSHQGASLTLLGNDEIARRVLAEDPYRLLKLNAVILFILLALGASVAQFLSIFQFVGLTAFALAAIVILNAIMLVDSGKIDQATFLEALRLSLTHTFVPIMGQILSGVSSAASRLRTKAPSAKPAKGPSEPKRRKSAQK